MGLHPRTLSSKILCLGTTLTLFIFFSLSTTRSTILETISFRQSPFSTGYFDRVPGQCTPKAYANGRWTGPHYRTNSSIMIDPSQALGFSGFSGCASSREFDWHLASNNPEQYDRFPNAQSYAWTVSTQDGCDGLDVLDKEKMVRDMVEMGGWMLVGDSITEGHFFSLSCLLHPHVIATPVYEPNSYFDRGWPQNLYLNPSSPLAKELFFPPEYEIAKTPLATFRRIDLLYTEDELKNMHHNLHPDTLSNFSLFSDEATWTLSPKEYLTEFFDRGFSTMVVSTAGHWTTTLFGGYSDPEPAFEGGRTGIDGVVDFFYEAMTQWATEVQTALDEVRIEEEKEHGRQLKKRQVLIRAYLPGHDNCHNIRDPWEEVYTPPTASYNWGSIWRYNEAFEKILMDKQKYPDIHYLAIERPGRLRPDAHATGDCLHIMTGAGVMEGWSHYIWHFINRELGRGRQTRIIS